MGCVYVYRSFIYYKLYTLVGTNEDVKSNEKNNVFVCFPGGFWSTSTFCKDIYVSRKIQVFDGFCTNDARSMLVVLYGFCIFAIKNDIFVRGFIWVFTVQDLCQWFSACPLNFIANIYVKGFLNDFGMLTFLMLPNKTLTQMWKTNFDILQQHLRQQPGYL